ncbi:MAG: MFS transporter [Caulobacteraceae bacterium]|nr:MFS transporter [Caulobacteraceae bacterium]
MNLRIFVLALSTFAFGSGALIFVGLLEPMAADLGVPVGAAGQLQTVYVLTSAFAGPPLAFLIGRFERKQVLLLALGASVALNLACYLTPGFGLILVLRAILGAIAAMAGPAASAAASALAPPERRGSALAIVMGGMTVAFLMGIPLGSVVGSIFGWRSAFLLSTGLSALALVAIALAVPRVTPPAPGPGQGLRGAAVLPLFASTFLAFGANMTITTYIAPILRLQAGVTGAGVAAFQMLVGVGSFIGLTLGGRAADRGAGGLSVTLGFLGLALAASLHSLELLRAGPAGWDAYAIVAMAVLAGSTALFSVMPVIQSRLIQRAPASAPLALAFNGSSASLGQAFGGALGGLLLAQGALSVTGASIVIALGAAAFWWMTNGRAAPSPPTQP